MINLRTVSNAYLRTLVHLVKQAGVDTTDMLTGIPLSLQQLQAPAGRVPIDIACRLWQRALDLTGDAALGLKFGLQAKPPAYAILGHALMSCASLQEALALLLRYQRLVSEAGTLYAEHDQGLVQIGYQPQPDVQLLPQQVEAILAGVCQQASWLASSVVVPAAVSFTHAQTGRLDDYLAAFHVAPTFHAEVASITFREVDLLRHSPLADGGMYRTYCQMAETTLSQLPAVGFVSGFASQWLRSQPLHSVQLDTLAKTLGVSIRSLQRYLNQEGSSWQALQESARREAALALLLENRTLEQVAQAVGYHDASSLSRAVKRWSGVTPKAWTALARQGLGG